MRIAVGVVLGALVGAVVGYTVGVVVACEVFHAGTLCGLLGVFITGPLGLVGGGSSGGASPGRAERAPGHATNGLISSAASARSKCAPRM